MQEPASVGDLVHASAYTSLGELSESGIFSTYIYILMKDQKNIGGKKNWYKRCNLLALSSHSVIKTLSAPFSFATPSFLDVSSIWLGVCTFITKTLAEKKVGSTLGLGPRFSSSPSLPSTQQISLMKILSFLIMKGVHINGLGTFAWSNEEPAFILSEKFASRHAVRAHSKNIDGVRRHIENWTDDEKLR